MMIDDIIELVHNIYDLEECVVMLELADESLEMIEIISKLYSNSHSQNLLRKLTLFEKTFEILEPKKSHLSINEKIDHFKKKFHIN